MKFFWDNNNEQQKNDQIDYSDYSNDQLLDSFKSDNWSKLDTEHRVAVIQEMENRSATEQGREPATVVSMDDSRYYGQYNDITNELRVDVKNVSSYESLDTYMHESNHAYQSYCVKNGEGYDDHTLSMIQAESARDEEGYLYNYASRSPEYDMQCNELDSNNKAADFMLSQKERYQDDAEYRSYISERAEHFKAVNTALENNVDERATMQNDQAIRAYVRGDLSEEQYNSLNQNFNDENFQDSAVQQSHAVGDSIIEADNEFQQEASNDVANEYMGDASNDISSGADISNEYMGDTHTAETHDGGTSSESMGSSNDSSMGSSSDSGQGSDGSMGMD